MSFGRQRQHYGAPAEQTTNVKPPPGTYSRQAPPAPTDQPEPAFLSMLKAVTGRR